MADVDDVMRRLSPTLRDAARDMIAATSKAAFLAVLRAAAAPSVRPRGRPQRDHSVLLREMADHLLDGAKEHTAASRVAKAHYASAYPRIQCDSLRDELFRAWKRHGPRYLADARRRRHQHAVVTREAIMLSCEREAERWQRESQHGKSAAGAAGLLAPSPPAASEASSESRERPPIGLAATLAVLRDPSHPWHARMVAVEREAAEAAARLRWLDANPEMTPPTKSG